MTGSELRMQLRMQQARNSLVARTATNPGGDATLCNHPAFSDGVSAANTRGAETPASRSFSPNSPNSAADFCHRHWWIHFPDREPLEVIFAPGQTHAEVLAIYPAALAAEPPPDVVAKPSNPETSVMEHRELRGATKEA